MSSSTESPTAPILVSSLPDLIIFLSTISPSSTLYLDCEGKSLGRDGKLTIMTILVHPTHIISLIDIQIIGKAAFTTPNANSKTLKAILEDPLIPKCHWDVRNDADALWAHYEVRLAGVIDVQLLENASRIGDKTYFRGLHACVQKDLKLKFMEINRWIKNKKEVQTLMANDIFSRRPLDSKVVQYCVNDVVYLPALHETYAKRIDSQWMKKAMDESGRRVVEACGPAYKPQSEMKKLGPWGSGLEKRLLTMDEYLDQYENDMMDAMEGDLLGHDFYEEYDDVDDYPMSSKDAAWDDTFDSCWEK
ncbi:hypothetical protein S40285_09017 [Stachybotrys chlorohalonatus IBT 40285]|uniref:3'-5' exonuclease domain-containing protein n=1 Tax=Stachybotrys chlorohalonatus (strain IBT 40285) TaxID=1283841 RepID=A0A084Q8Y2_STAC4|nr:hypothetical protein S40285_09017 [Stachybotrys chlorohalonata IBT 40285]